LSFKDIGFVSEVINMKMNMEKFEDKYDGIGGHRIIMKL